VCLCQLYSADDTSKTKPEENALNTQVHCRDVGYIGGHYDHRRCQCDSIFIVIFIHQQNGSNNIIVNKKKIE